MAMPQARIVPWRLYLVLSVVLGGAFAAGIFVWFNDDVRDNPASIHDPHIAYQPRRPVDNSGAGYINDNIPPWPARASLRDLSTAWKDVGQRLYQSLDVDLIQADAPANARMQAVLTKASLLNYQGEVPKAYRILEEARRFAESDSKLAAEWLYTVISYQGITALRMGEIENCILCRGASSCILPIVPAAYHQKPEGSRRAIDHFSEYLRQFPDDAEIRWLLNIAHMTLGEYPSQVDSRFLVSLDRYNSPEHGIGKFKDVGHLAGINRLNFSGGAILDDFDNDDQLDIVFTSLDPSTAMVLYRNSGDGTFEDRTQAAGLSEQRGGLYCVQADYNNDGFLDIYIPRGAWYRYPMRPSLLKNDGKGGFTDATEEAGLLDPVNSISASWADFDNDGWLDLFVCCEQQPNRLFRNRGDGTFENVAFKAGVAAPHSIWKGAAWIDFDGDRYPDLFLNNFTGMGRLYRNNRDATFTDITQASGILGPRNGFSCWAFDYDNDGWPDIFATSYDHRVTGVLNGMLGEPFDGSTTKLFRNLGGKGFQDVSAATGVNLVFAAMGSNFADFDNDGYLDFYLGTGDPQFSTLVPNRMFRNLGGQRFADISGSSGTGHLQKGHGVACGDWRRAGLTDIVIEMGGAVHGDRYHNVLFANPGQGNHWLNVKLVGKKTNRSAIGARIKVVTAGANPQTAYRWVSSGSSFGANPLEQSIGLGKAERVAELEIYWPTSDTTQTFRDLNADQFLEITELAKDYRRRDLKPISLP